MIEALPVQKPRTLIKERDEIAASNCRHRKFLRI